MAAPQQQSNQDSSTNILWGIAAIFIILGLIWFLLKTQIIVFFLSIKLYEAKFLGLTHLLNADRLNEIENAIASAIASPTKVEFNYLMILANAVGNSLRYLFIGLLIILALVVYFGNTTRVFKRIYSMEELAKLEKENWPQITPVVGLDLMKQDIDVGPWAMALTPMQFCKRYKLLEEVKPQRTEGMSRKDWNKLEVILKRGEATTLLNIQLGTLFKDTKSLPPHTRALFAVFAARINADSKPAEAMLAQLAASSTGKVNYSGVDELLKKHENSKLVQEVIASHAYVYTVMASMLERARDDGVQASSDFLWIKPVDRQLWYVLNTVGRQTPFAEVAGVFAHWIAEKEAGIKIITPMVTEAINGFELALKEVVYRPDEELQGK